MTIGMPACHCFLNQFETDASAEHRHKNRADQLIEQVLRPPPDPARAGAPLHCAEERCNEMTMLFEAGVLLFSATLPMGTNTLVSGKYVAAQRRGIGYGYTAK